MPTTEDVLHQHLKCFGENNLDGLLADYSSDAVLFKPGVGSRRDFPCLQIHTELEEI